MPVNWIDVSSLSFNTLLLLERVQLSWFPGWLPETELAVALRANPVVEWYMRHKCPELNGWLDGVMARAGESQPLETAKVRRAEEVIMKTINDLLTYVVDPGAYDAQPFLGWDAQELVSLVDFTGQTVIDIGSGTGRLALLAAEKAEAVYAVEPVTNLREYLKDKARKQGLGNVYAVDGLITDLPFSDRFADVTMGGHVFGDQPEEEYGEMVRVTKPGGMVILCPGSADREDERHRFLISKGFEWSRYEEPGAGVVRKYWRSV
jgi:2-polyprenyl-3-methyl-5-hydroxy-6-metoxy-1,4-benzoquinol methylase